MKYLIITLFFSCNYMVNPELKGTYCNDQVILTFDNGKITGNTKCNSLQGGYILMDDNISISIGGTKVFCECEFNIQKLRDMEKYSIIKDKLILRGENLELILYKL